MSFARVDEMMRQAVEKGAFPAAVLLAGRGEKVLFRRAYGRLGPGETEPKTSEQTRFDLASLTKPLVVAMLTLRALESGTAVILAVVYPHGREPLELTLDNASGFRELRLSKSTVITTPAMVPP